MSDWESDEETPYIWDQYGLKLGETGTPKKWNMYPWEENLGVTKKGNQLKEFDEQYNLRKQELIRSDSKKLVEKLKLSDEDKKSVLSTLELIVTFYSKKLRQPYKSDNGWMELLIPLTSTKLSPHIIFNLFEAIRNRYIIKNYKYNRILWLLFLYHDPELALFIEQKRVSFEEFSNEWVKTLFAASCTPKIVLKLWQYYFKTDERKTDPLFVFYLILTIVIRSRETILNMKNDNKDIIKNALSSLPNEIKSEEIDFICSNAENYKLSTPLSFEEEYNPILFYDKGITPEIPDLPCLHVLPSELLVEIDAIYSNQPLQPIKFLVIDCRPIDQFKAGHLPTAFNLDYTLHFRNPQSFANHIDNLVSLQQEGSILNVKSPDIHFCFMGYGDEEQDYNMIMVITSIIQIHVKYISILKGGYKVVHDCHKDEISCSLEDHSRKHCLLCNPPKEKEKVYARPKKKSIMRSLGSVMCLNVGKYQDVDEPDGYSLGRFKCNRLMFEVVVIEDYARKIGALHSYKCNEINESEEYESQLFITKSNLVLLRIVRGHPHVAYITAIHSLETLMKITAQKNNPNIVIFKYGEHVVDEIVITEKDQLRIPNANEVVKLISRQVLKEMRELQGPSKSKRY